MLPKSTACFSIACTAFKAYFCQRLSLICNFLKQKGPCLAYPITAHKLSDACQHHFLRLQIDLSR